MAFSHRRSLRLADILRLFEKVSVYAYLSLEAVTTSTRVKVGNALAWHQVDVQMHAAFLGL
jgi:hypothetical protein